MHCLIVIETNSAVSNTRDNILYSDLKPIGSPIKTVGAYCWDKLSKLPEDLVCLIDASTDEKLTIGELKYRANSIGVALVNRGVTKQDTVAFSGQNSIQHTIMRFAVKLLGITFMPLSPTFERYEVEQEIIASRTNIIMTAGQDYHKFEHLLLDSNANVIKQCIVFDVKQQQQLLQHRERHVTYGQLLADGSGQQLPQIPYFNVNPETDVLFLVHTSGSTGRPKCAMIGHRTFINASQYSKIYLNYEDNPKHDITTDNSTIAKPTTTTTVCAIPYPCGHVSGTCMIPLQIIAGVQCVIMGQFDEELLFRSIEKYGIHILPAFPSFGRRLIEGDLADRYDLSSLIGMSTGGAPFPGHIARQIIEKYNLVFRETYGMTEYIWFTTGEDVMDGNQLIPGNVGRVSPGGELKIIDLNTGASLGANSDGEICIRGVRLFMGYLDNDTANRVAIDADGWYRTGDIGYYDNRERLFITGRVKEVIRVGVDNHYVNINPSEIEMFVLTHPSIAEVAVVGVNNIAGTHWPRAYVVLKQGHSVIGGDDIKKYVSETMAYTKQLKGGVVFVHQIHRTSIGKVDRKYYRNLVENELLD
ncbi:uncharacterized protein LOC128951330 [Oppia nitens]|uniref:uncharacterized protein LOC128951330 n=1 Tax=Oppia nitens TaxID=1686743 RepID=UPI0023DCCE25|nr:uncharacterized protein LOC128951330 [Oppia nitens]